MDEGCSVHVRMSFHMYGNVYPFHSFLAWNSTHIISEASNLVTTFVLMLIVIVFKFRGLATWMKGV